MDSCPSGRQVEIAYNGRRATVDEVGGGEIRCYEVGGRSVFDPFPIDTICDGAHGAPRIPWPNRLVDGHYRFHDEHRLPAGTEPVDGTAYDFRESRLLGATTLDFAFTDLVRDADGWARARLGGTEGRTVEIWAEDSYRGIELYAGDSLAAFGHHPRRATQVGAATVAAGRSYITTRDLTGFCEDADWTTRMSGKERSYRCDRRS